DQQIGDDLATIEHVYREETGDLGELGHRIGGTRFQVTEGRTVVYETPGWPPAVDGPYRTGVLADATHRITAARDDTSVRRTLRTLALILVMGVPFAVALAIGGGYVLAGRMLAPFGGLAEKARRITAESLAERLPVGNPRDEFGQLAGVVNAMLSRLQAAFGELRRVTAGAVPQRPAPHPPVR